MDVQDLQDAADKFARAIAKAEGFGLPGALPTRANNPGDMMLGDRGWGNGSGEDSLRESGLERRPRRQDGRLLGSTARVLRGAFRNVARI